MLKKEERIKNFSKIYKSMFCVFYDISKLDNLYEKYLKKIINYITHFKQNFIKNYLSSISPILQSQVSFFLHIQPFSLKETKISLSI